MHHLTFVQFDTYTVRGVPLGRSGGRRFGKRGLGIGGGGRDPRGESLEKGCAKVGLIEMDGARYRCVGEHRNAPRRAGVPPPGEWLVSDVR